MAARSVDRVLTICNFSYFPFWFSGPGSDCYNSLSLHIFTFIKDSHEQTDKRPLFRLT